MVVKEEKVDEASHKGVGLGDKDFLDCDRCLYDYMFVFSHASNSGKHGFNDGG